MHGSLGSSATLLIAGHVLMAVCAALYLAWWSIFFRPDAGKVTGALYGFGVTCIVIAALAGIAGAIIIGLGTARIPQAERAPSGWWYVAGAVVVYIALAFITSRFLHRPVTTELVLFVAWTALELAVVITLSSVGALTRPASAGAVALIITLFVCMLVTYLLYYHLGPLASFIDGAIPLAAVGLYSAATAIML